MFGLESFEGKGEKSKMGKNREKWVISYDLLISKYIYIKFKIL